MKKKVQWIKKIQPLIKKHPRITIGIAFVLLLFIMRSCIEGNINVKEYNDAYARGNELGIIAADEYKEAESYFTSAKTSGKYAEVTELCEQAKDLYSDAEGHFTHAQESYLEAENYASSNTLEKLAKLVAQETALLANISSARQETCELLELTAYAAELYRTDRTSRNLLGVKYYENATKEQLKKEDALFVLFNEVRSDVNKYKAKVD